MQKVNKTSIGLDVGTRFIKFVELKRSGDAIILNKFGIKEIPKGLGLDKDKLISQLISQLFSENAVKTRNVNISAGGQSVFVRFVKLLQIKEDKLKQTMRFEAQNQIPFPLDEVAWDWSLLNRDKKNTRKAVIVAIKKNLVEAMISRLDKIRLSPKVIDVSPISLYNCMAFNEDYREDRLGAILDIGSRTSNLVIFKRGSMWIRSFPIASDRIEEAKEQGMDELIGEIERSIEYYFMQSEDVLDSEKRLEDLVLTGGGSAMEKIELRLASRFNIKPRILDPFRKLRISKEVFSNIQAKTVKNQLAVAVGLALRDITPLKIEVNFLKEMISQRVATTQKTIYSRLSMAMTVFILISLSVFMRQDYSVKRIKLNKVDEILNTYNTYEPKMKRLEEREDVLKSKLDILYNTAEARAIWLDSFKTISEILPKEVWITDMSGIVSLEKSGLGRLDLSGKALSYQSVNNFVSYLKSSPNFKDVKPISSSIETDEITGEEIVKFSITMDVVVAES